MSKNIVLKKGMNIPIAGEAELRVSKAIAPGIVAVCPTDIKGLLPRLLVKEGDTVLCGSPVIADKKNPDILLASPVSGTVKELVRGDKRKLLAVLIEADEEQKCVDFGAKDVEGLDASAIRESILQAGLWPWLVQRPYGILTNPADTPRDIFVSAFDTAPLAADTEFCYAEEAKAIQVGVTALSKLTSGKVHVSLSADNANSALARLQNAEIHFFKGKHPAGNVGVQIASIAPVRKGDIVWTISLAGLAAIGKLFSKGRYDVRRKVAVCGPMAIEPAYVDALPGINMADLKDFYDNSGNDLRFVSGDVLTGENVGKDGSLGFFDNQVTLLHEGTEREVLGWAKPFRFGKFSSSHTYFSWLCPKKKYDMDTNTNGGPRAFVMSDVYKKVLPMDIFPVFLVKACLAGDIDKMEKFGIYEVLPEDLALCEYVDPSKNDIQAIIEKGIDLMIKEMA